MPETICLLDMTTPERADRLRAFLPDGFVLTHGTARGDEHMKQIIAEADYAISGQVGVSGDVLRAAKKLKLLHKWGVGYDNIDALVQGQLRDAKGREVITDPGGKAWRDIELFPPTVGAIGIETVILCRQPKIELELGRDPGPACIADPG